MFLGEKEDSLEDISNGAAGLIMKYTRSPEEVSKCVQTLSEYIYIQLDIKLN